MAGSEYATLTTDKVLRVLTMVLYWSLRNRKGLKVALQRPFSGWEAHDLTVRAGTEDFFNKLGSLIGS